MKKGFFLLAVLFFCAAPVWADDFQEFMRRRGGDDSQPTADADQADQEEASGPFGDYIVGQKTRRPIRLAGFPFYFGSPEDDEFAPEAIQESHYSDYWVQLAFSTGVTADARRFRSSWTEAEMYFAWHQVPWLRLNAKYTFSTSDGHWHDKETGARGRWNVDEHIWSLGPNIRLLNTLDSNTLFRVHTSGTYRDKRGERDGSSREFLVFEERLSWWPRLLGLPTNIEWAANYNGRPGSYTVWTRARIKANLLEVDNEGQPRFPFTQWKDFYLGEQMFVDYAEPPGLPPPWLNVRAGVEVEAYGGHSVPSWHRQAGGFIELHSPRLGGLTIEAVLGGGDSGRYSRIGFYLPIFQW